MYILYSENSNLYFLVIQFLCGFKNKIFPLTSTLLQVNAVRSVLMGIIPTRTYLSDTLTDAIVSEDRCHIVSLSDLFHWQTITLSRGHTVSMSHCNTVTL